MRATAVFALLVAPVVIAVPTVDHGAVYNAAEGEVVARQATPKPAPCKPITPEPTEEQLVQRMKEFADAFIYNKNISKAFEYINTGYIVRIAPL
jgi:hypothetical protein